VPGQFVYQDTVNSAINLPDIAAYLHFTIKTFNAFIRAENLNAVTFRSGQNAGVKFVRHNLVAERRPQAGLVMRLGVYWRFVN
jgi:hypothetical protein